MPGDEQIKVTVGADLTGFQSAFAQAKEWITSFVDTGTSAFTTVSESASESAASTKESLDSIQESIKKLIELFGIYEALKWGKEAVFGGMELADQLYRTNTITGISVQELERLKFAAEATGSSFESVTRMVEFASRALLQLRSSSGGERIKVALGDLGLKPADLADNEHLLEKVAEGLDKVHNSATKIGDLRALFGRQGAEALPMLASLKELEEEFNKLGFAVSDVGVAKAWEAGEAWNKLESVLEFVKLQLAADLGAALEAVADIAIRVAGDFDTWLKSPAAAQWGKNLVDGAVDFAEAVDTQLMPVLKAALVVLEDMAKIIETIAHPISQLPTVGLGAAAGGLVGGYPGAIAGGAAAAAVPGVETKLLGGVITLRSILHGSAGGSWIEKIGPAAAAAKPPLDALGKVLEDIRNEADKPVSGKVLQQFKGSTAAAPTGGPPQTAAEIIQEIAARAKAQESALAITEAADKQRLAYGQETASQEIAQEQALANQKYQIQLSALQKESAVGGQKAAEHAKILAEIQELENAHVAQMTGLATKLTEAQNKESARRVEEEIKGQNQQLAVAQAMVGLHEKMNLIDATQAAQIKDKLVTDELGQEKRKLDALLQNNQLALADRQKYSDQIRDIDQKLTLELIANQQRIVEDTQKSAAESAKSWQDALDPISKTFDGLINDMLDAQKKAGESMHQVLAGEFKKTLDEMVKAFIASGLKSLLTGGGAAGTLTGSIFGTAGGGAQAPGGKGTEGILGLGGGLAGFLSRLLPAGPGGILKSLLGGGASDAGAASLTTAGTTLKTAADAHLTAAAALSTAATGLQKIIGAPNTLPATAVTGPGIPEGPLPPSEITGGAPDLATTLSTLTSNTDITAGSGLPVVITGKEEGIETPAINPILPPAANPLSAITASTPTSIPGSTPTSLSSASEALQAAAGQLKTSDDQLLSAAVQLQTSAAQLSAAAASKSAPPPSSVAVAPANATPSVPAVFGGAQAATGQSVPLGDAGSQQASQALLTAAIQLQTAATALRTVATQLATTATHGAVSVPAAAPASGGGGGGGELAKITPLVSQSIGFLGSIGGNTGKMVAGIAQLVVSAAEQLIQLIALVIKPSFLGFTGASGGFTDKLGRGSTKVDDGKGGMLAVLHPHELILNQEQTSAFMTVPSAERGMIVPSAAAGMVVPGGGGGVPAILHPKEMVLPANISQGVQNMVAQGGAGGQGGTGGSGGDAESDSTGGDFNLTNHFHSSAIDGRGMNELFKQHAASISKIVMDHYNRKGGRYPAFGAG